VSGPLPALDASLARPEEVASAAGGDLFILDRRADGKSDILRLERSSGLVSPWRSDLDGLRAIAAGGGGFLYAAFDDGVRRLQVDTAEEEGDAFPAAADALAVLDVSDGRELLWAAQELAAIELEWEGSSVRRTGRGIDLDGTGSQIAVTAESLFVADVPGDTVSVHDIDAGVLVNRVARVDTGQALVRPSGVAAMGRSIFITERGPGFLRDLGDDALSQGHRLLEVVDPRVPGRVARLVAGNPTKSSTREFAGLAAADREVQSVDPAG
jgi:hypothetical protein